MTFASRYLMANFWVIKGEVKGSIEITERMNTKMKTWTKTRMRRNKYLRKTRMKPLMRKKEALKELEKR